MNTNQPIRVVICDDHKVVVEGLVSLLEGVDDVRCIGTAHNGRSTLELLGTVTADVLLLDLNLPDMDGFEVLQRARKAWPQLRIAILSMNAEAVLIRRGMKAGATGYLLKTCCRNELLAGIRAVHSGQTFHSKEVGEILSRRSTAKAHPRLGELTGREIEVLRALALGHTNKEIADRLHISPRTVDTHRTNMMRKLGAHNVAELVHLAFATKLVQ